MRLQNLVVIPLILVLIISFGVICISSVSYTENTASEIMESQMRNRVDSVSYQVELTENIVSIVLDMMDHKNISLAKSLAQLIAESEDNLQLDKMNEFTEIFGVDEVHVTDENGVLYWGNITDFYGLDFHESDQTKALLPILNDPNLVIAQKPMPRAADGVMFQYVSVSRVDQPGIVQVGVSMQQIDDIRSSMSIQKSIADARIGQSGGVFLIGSDKNVVADSFNNLINKDLSQEIWVDNMFKLKEGKTEFHFEDTDYFSYYRSVGDYMAVAYVPKSELEVYSLRVLSGIIPMGVAATLIVILITVLFLVWVSKKVYWYENILDCIPFPVSITNNDMKWEFINKPAEIAIGRKRSEVVGQSCVNWGAGICGTENCGVRCLEKGISTTGFSQQDMDFKVDVSYLTNKSNKRVGHIEVVQDITEMNKTQKYEARLVENIRGASSSFVVASKQISDGANALAEGCTRQASSVEQISSAFSDIAQKTRGTAHLADHSAKLMDEMTAAMKDINLSSHSINNVIKVINDIAFQTNILALNASVEAARAGQHGKGFAVVAEEVRSLAAKSAEAANTINSMLADSMSKTELGERISNETAASLMEIVSGINDIAKSAEEQSLGIGDVAQVIQHNSATAEESAAAADEMSAQSSMLEGLMQEYSR